jgi:hypothetical protein
MQQSVEFVEEIAKYSLDPLAFVQCMYPWGEGDLIDSKGPRKWQEEYLAALTAHLKNPKTRFRPYRTATASGHGIGKSALVAFLIGWGLSTCEDTKIVITANTGKQLATKTVPEVSKWFRLIETRDWWNVKSESITFALDREHEKTWRADFVSWSENNAEAFAGLHNKRKRIIVIFDESSAIADIIFDVAQGALTDEETEIIFAVFGNPTQNQGRFAECFGSDKARWGLRQIDSRKVEGTNVEEYQEWVDKYGEDSDYIRVRVRGEFPRSGSAQFIGTDVVSACRRYQSKGHESLPKILACDVARFGDDQTVIGIRQGRKFEILGTYRGLDTVQTTDQVIEHIKARKPDAIVIDGDGIGGAVVDGLKHLGYKPPVYNVFEFHGGGTPQDTNMYFNKRAEVWGWMKDWLEAGAEIPNDPELERDLTGPTYGIIRGKVQHGSIYLEEKQDMKKRGLSSPDKGDTLAMTFAVKVAPKPKPGPASRPASPWS